MEEINKADIALPPGFRFTPTVEELINLYLIPKNTNQPLPCNVIKEKPLYSDDPWKVLDINNPHNKWDIADTNEVGYVSKMRIYIFTKLTKKKQAMVDEKKKKQAVVNDDGDEAKQFVRQAGSGTWKSHTGKKEITNEEGKVIGFTRQLAFITKKRVNPNNPSTSSGSSTPPPGRYTMHEYSVAGGESKFVLCEVTLWFKRMRSGVCNVKEEVDFVEEVTRDVGKRLRVDDGHNQLGGAGDVNHHVALSCSSEQYVGAIGGGYQGSSEHEQFMMVGNNSSGLIPGQVNHITEHGVEKPLQVIDHERFEQSPMALEAAVDDEDEYFKLMQKQLQQQHAMRSPGYNEAYDRETWNLLQECGIADVDWNHSLKDVYY